MKLADLLSLSCVKVDLQAATKKAVLEELVAALTRDQKLKNPEPVLQALIEREKLGSTGIGQGIAIPHAKTEEARGIAAAFGVARRGVPFDALDGEPVHLVFLLVAPPDAAADHLKTLARVSRLLKDKFFRQSLRDAKTSADVLRLIKEEDSE